MKIRRMKEEDVTSVAAIEKRCFSAPWSRQAFLDSLAQPDAVFLAAEGDAGEILGYLGMYVCGEEGEITNVAVDLPYRRHGVASSLLQVLFAQAAESGVRVIFLEVRVTNAGAIRLYEGLGFHTVALRKDFYLCPREDAYLMRADLQDDDKRA